MSTESANSASFTPQDIAIFSFCAMAMLKGTENIIDALTTFKSWRGLYFYAMIVCNVGLIVHDITIIPILFDSSNDLSFKAAIFGINFAWVMMVTGFATILYSRLSVVCRDQRIIRFALIMIIVDAICIHGPAFFASIVSAFPGYEAFGVFHDAFEEYQVMFFFVQEAVLSGIYIRSIYILRKQEASKRYDRVLKHAIIMNVFVISLDFLVAALQFASLYSLQAPLKAFIYSIKAHVEFRVLNALKKSIQGPSASVNSKETHDGKASEIRSSKFTSA
jgi:hypothetical protein